MAFGWDQSGDLLSWDDEYLAQRFGIGAEHNKFDLITADGGFDCSVSCVVLCVLSVITCLPTHLKVHEIIHQFFWFFEFQQKQTDNFKHPRFVN